EKLGLASPNFSKSLSDVSNIIDFKSVDTFNAKILYLNAQSLMDKRDMLQVSASMYCRSINQHGGSGILRRQGIRFNKAKLRANETLINSGSNPWKAAWSIIATIRSPTTSSTPDNSPEAFSDFFVDTMKEVRRNITPSNSSADDLLGRAPRTTNSFKWNPVTCEEISKIVNKIKSSNSKDIYGLSSVLLKKICFSLILPLTW
ncbi:hypothetical protein J6590_107804, partial [Homalodisca vitripennis]